MFRFDGFRKQEKSVEFSVKIWTVERVFSFRVISLCFVHCLTLYSVLGLFTVLRSKVRKL